MITRTIKPETIGCRWLLDQALVTVASNEVDTPLDRAEIHGIT